MEITKRGEARDVDVYGGKGGGAGRLAVTGLLDDMIKAKHVRGTINSRFLQKLTRLCLSDMYTLGKYR